MTLFLILGGVLTWVEVEKCVLIALAAIAIAKAGDEIARLHRCADPYMGDSHGH